MKNLTGLLNNSILSIGLASCVSPIYSQITAPIELGGSSGTPSFVYFTIKPESENILPNKLYSLNLELDLSRIQYNEEVDKINWSLSPHDALGDNITSGIVISSASRPTAENDIFLGRTAINQRINTSLQNQTLDFGSLNYPSGTGSGESQNTLFATYKFFADESLIGKDVFFWFDNLSAYDSGSTSSGTYNIFAQGQAFQVIPEPSTNVITALSLATFAYYIQRNRKNKKALNQSANLSL